MKLNKQQQLAIMNGILFSFVQDGLLKEDEHTSVSATVNKVDSKLDNITLKSDKCN